MPSMGGQSDPPDSAGVPRSMNKRWGARQGAQAREKASGPGSGGPVVASVLQNWRGTTQALSGVPVTFDPNWDQNSEKEARLLLVQKPQKKTGQLDT